MSDQNGMKLEISNRITAKAPGSWNPNHVPVNTSQENLKNEHKPQHVAICERQLQRHQEGDGYLFTSEQRKRSEVIIQTPKKKGEMRPKLDEARRKKRNQEQYK